MITSDEKEIEEIQMKLIEMLKIDLRKEIEISSKLNQTLSKIENRFFTKKSKILISQLK